jgi:hypothetical protein
LSLRIDCVERKRGLAGSTDARYHNQFTVGQFQIQVFQIILPGIANLNALFGHVFLFALSVGWLPGLVAHADVWWQSVHATRSLCNCAKSRKAGC